MFVLGAVVTTLVWWLTPWRDNWYRRRSGDAERCRQILTKLQQEARVVRGVLGEWRYSSPTAKRNAEKVAFDIIEERVSELVHLGIERRAAKRLLAVLRTRDAKGLSAIAPQVQLRIDALIPRLKKFVQRYAAQD